MTSSLIDSIYFGDTFGNLGIYDTIDVVDEDGKGMLKSKMDVSEL